MEVNQLGALGRAILLVAPAAERVRRSLEDLVYGRAPLVVFDAKMHAEALAALPLVAPDPGPPPGPKSPGSVLYGGQLPSAAQLDASPWLRGWFGPLPASPLPRRAWTLLTPAPPRGGARARRPRVMRVRRSR